MNENDHSHSHSRTSSSPDSPLSYTSKSSGHLLPMPDSPLPLDSPSASTFLRTAETLEGLAKQLGEISDDLDNEGEVRCCCGALVGEGSTAANTAAGAGCRMLREREKMEDKLKLSGEIGNALLQRYEALERKAQRDVERYEQQLQVKRTALVDSVKRVHNLEKANHTHLHKYAEMSRKTEALEKRYTQAMHNHTLTQQSLTHVRAELTTLRSTNARQNLALASGAGVELMLADAEKRYEDARDAAEAEKRTAKDEQRKRKRAEARIAELLEQLSAASKEVEDIREAKAKEASDLLANAKERLEVLHTELSETFRTESPADMPEYQRALENLVANNALLKHDTAELSHSLSESRDEVRALKEEIEELRAAIGVVGRTTPLSTFPHPQRLASELGQYPSMHSRTESSPILDWGHGDRTSWQRFSVASSTRTPGMSAWEHHRRMSMTPSFATTSTADGIASPGLGMGPVGEFGGVLVNEDGARVDALSPPPMDGNESPKPIFRTSPSGGIGYVLNGVPKRPGAARPPANRSFSSDRRGIRSFNSQHVGSIAEWSGAEEESATYINNEPSSPGTDYFRAAEANRKRRSLMLARRSTMSPQESTDYSNASHTLVDQTSVADYPSPMSDSAITGTSPKRAKRRTLLLLTKSMGVQTDPVEGGVEKVVTVTVGKNAKDMVDSARTSPNPPTEDQSETSSLHDSRAGALLVLIEHLSRILSKVRSADIPTLNKRLKKAHLPGDVGHLSTSTLRNLQTEIADLRNQFRGATNLGGIDRRDFNLLLRLFKDVFNDLVELQAVVNDVTITPSLAKKLRAEAFKDDEDEMAKAAKQASGLGWIAAPITKFFVTPAEVGREQESVASTTKNAVGRAERGRLQPMPAKAVKAAPKQQATASATTTHVSVEFGGTGIVRRATPASSASTSASASGETSVLPSSPSEHVNRTVSAATSTTGPDGSLAPPTRRTLRPSKSRANRNELLGIFAGAGAGPRPSLPSPVGEAWTVLGHGPAPLLTSASGTGTGTGGTGEPKTIRAVSSGYFGDRTIRQNDGWRKRLPAAVDAVIDSSADQLDQDDSMSTAIVGSYEPPLLERTLRPRGLSDSSIRSTFVSHAAEGVLSANAADVGVGGLVGRAGGYSIAPEGGGGIFQNLQKRWYGRASTEVSPINPDPPASAPASASAETTSNHQPANEPTPSYPTLSRSPPRPIRPNANANPNGSSTRSSSISTTRSAHSRTSASASASANRDRPTSTSPVSQSQSQQNSNNGIIGRLASSLAATAATADEYEEEDDMALAGATLRHAPLRGGKGGGGWR